MRFAYADPPYLGLAVAFYGDQHPDARIYDTIEGHAALIARLCADFSDGWAAAKSKTGAYNVRRSSST